LSLLLHICNQSFKKVLIGAKKIFFSKIQYGYQKFHADLESDEKGLKNAPKKSY
jgi:hypothetical protein